MITSLLLAEGLAQLGCGIGAGIAGSAGLRYWSWYCCYWCRSGYW